MSNYLSRVDKVATAFTRFVLKYKYLVVLVVVGVAFGISTGASKLTFTPDYRVFFSGDNPELETFLEFQDTYTKNDNFYFVIKPKDDNVYTKDVISAVKELTDGAWGIPYANRVDSLTNFQNSYSKDGDLVVEDLVYEPASLTSADLNYIREVAESEPLIRGQFVTPSGDATALNVVLQLPGETVYEVPKAAGKARELKAQIEESYPSIDVSLTGFGMLNNAFGESGYMDSVKLVPIMYLVLVISALIVLRSVVGTLITLAVAYLAMGVGMGIGGYSGIFLTPVSNSAPIIIITLAVADSVHIFLSFKKLMRNGSEKYDAIVEAMRRNFLPVAVTSITTVVGFLSLNFSDSPPYWHLGNMSAAGIAAAWLLSVTLFPALLGIIPHRTKSSHKEVASYDWYDKFGTAVFNNAKIILVAGVVITIGFASFVPTIEFDDQWSDYFDESIEFRRDTDEATKYFGLYPIEYSVPAVGPQGVADPDYLRNLEKFTEFLKKQDHVTHVYSVTDILKRLNANMHDDLESFYRLPEDRATASDYLLVYELSLPYGLDLNDRINVDKSASRITVTLDKVSTSETKEFINRTNDWIQSNLPGYMADSNPTSAHIMFTYITDRNVDSMITGTAVAIVVIALILVASLRSLSMGVFSILTNGIPILVGFGIWAVLVGTVGFSIASVAAISLGVVVDDTVHFLSKYHLGRTENDYGVRDAIIYAYRSVAPAMVSCTLILVCGLIVMSRSTFKMNEDLGMLTAITIVVALIYDLLFLPALLAVFDRKSQKDTEFEEEGAIAGAGSVLPSSGSSLSMLIVCSITLCAFLLFPVERAIAEEIDPMDKGYKISALSDRSDRGFDNSQTRITMTLRNANGDEAKRVMDMKTLEMPSEDVGDKSIVLFLEPSDVSGTALLSHAHILDPDDQWLYLNSMNRIKRISSRNKSGPFMGSEFAFEDFTSQELNKYSHEWISEEPCGEFACDVIRRVPRYDYSGYSYIKVWIDQDVHQLRKAEYYDRKEDLLKTLVLDNYRDYDGYWRSHFWRMENNQTNKVTDLVFEEFDFGIGLTDSDFLKSRLRYIN